MDWNPYAGRLIELSEETEDREEIRTWSGDVISHPLRSAIDQSTLVWPRDGEVLISTGIPLHKLKGRIDWCQGCDGLWKPWSMDWTDLGLYRCADCRKY